MDKNIAYSVTYLSAARPSSVYVSPLLLRITTKAQKKANMPCAKVTVYPHAQWLKRVSCSVASCTADSKNQSEDLISLEARSKL